MQLDIEITFWPSVAFQYYLTIINVAFHVSLGILIALALNHKNLIGKKIYRALFVLPWAIPGYIAALTWRNMYDDRFGAFNQLLAIINQNLGTSLPTNTRWLDVAQPPIAGLLSFLPLAFYCLLLANIWLGWPFMTVVATGALQSIPQEMLRSSGYGWRHRLVQILDVTLR